MIMRLENVGQSFANRVLFDGANLSIEEGDRIGLVGANGVGKSTLFEILSGELQPTNGERICKRGLQVGYLRQNSGLESDNTIFEELRQVFNPLLEAQAQMKELEAQIAAHPEKAHELQESYGRLQSYFETNEGYQIEVKIETVLNGMGFSGWDRQTLCGTLSGGERTRLALAKLLLKQPELLMLDEPTNHLDFATLTWLEDYLMSYRGSFVVISHDRYFLDRICTRIWDLNGLEVTPYRGNYSKFLTTRDAIWERKWKEYEMQQQQVVKLTDYIARNKVRASTASMAHSREKELERIQENMVHRPPNQPKPLKLRFRYEEDPWKDVLQVKDLTVYAGGQTEGPKLLEHLDMQITLGDKVAIVGPNGVGKSTLLKALGGRLEPAGGRIRWGRNVVPSYFAQDDADLFHYKTVREQLWDYCPSTSELDIRRYLASLQLEESIVDKRIDQLSGGEKAKIKFIMMLYDDGNVLMMDEPSNHLDLPAREALDEALMAYEGTLLFISHDRYLLSRVPTRILELTPEGPNWYQGNFEDYQKAKNRERELRAAAAAQTPEPVKEQSQTAQGYYRSKQQRSEQAANKRRLAQVEQEISDLEAQIAQLEEKLVQPDVVSDYEKCQACSQELSETQQLLNDRMEDWAMLSEEVAAAESH